jgi:hypothetical protein
MLRDAPRCGAPQHEAFILLKNQKLHPEEVGEANRLEGCRAIAGQPPSSRLLA